MGKFIYNLMKAIKENVGDAMLLEKPYDTLQRVKTFKCIYLNKHNVINKKSLSIVYSGSK